MFYNKAIFAENSIEVPATWEELMAACDTLAQAGFAMPIGLGGADKYPISWWQSLLWGRFAGPEGVDNVMFGDGRWDEEPFVQATAALKELNDAGCFGPNPLAEIQNDVEARFWRGEIPMVFTGPWIIGPGIDAVGEDIANFSVFPGSAAGRRQADLPDRGHRHRLVRQRRRTSTRTSPPICSISCSSGRRAGRRCWRAATTCRSASSIWTTSSCPCSCKRSSP